MGGTPEARFEDDVAKRVGAALEIALWRTPADPLTLATSPVRTKT